MTLRAADSRTFILSADEFKGNVFEFFYNVSDPTVKATVPKNVFQELRGRYGNVYYIDEEGIESAVEVTSRALKDCLSRGGCSFVPGLSEQQRQFSLIAITSGGFLFGAVLRGGLSAWTWIFAFIWVPWVGLFGFFPLYQRQPEDLTPLFQNAGIFIVCLTATYLSPVFGQVKLPDILVDNVEPPPPPPSPPRSAPTAAPPADEEEQG